MAAEVDNCGFAAREDQGISELDVAEKEYLLAAAKGGGEFGLIADVDDILRVAEAFVVLAVNIAVESGTAYADADVSGIVLNVILIDSIDSAECTAVTLTSISRSVVCCEMARAAPMMVLPLPLGTAENAVAFDV